MSRSILYLKILLGRTCTQTGKQGAEILLPLVPFLSSLAQSQGFTNSELAMLRSGKLNFSSNTSEKYTFFP